MDTIRVKDSSKIAPRKHDYSVDAMYIFIGGFALFVIGLWTSVNVVAGVGLFSFVLAFLYLHSTMWSKTIIRRSLRKFFTDSKFFRG